MITLIYGRAGVKPRSLIKMNPIVTKFEGAADPRRQGCSCSNLPKALDNAGSVFRKILYPTDFSDVSKRAMAYLKQLKKKWSRRDFSASSN